jgi:hypothetical protein
LPKPFRLDVSEGISVYQAHASNAPRLPLLGLRGLVRNNLRLTIGGMAVSLQKDRKTLARGNVLH